MFRLGTDYTLSYKANPDYSESILSFTGGKGVDVILDPILA
jgi:NADPH:quinone reductase-like Zn-dependent oxidoreductase